MQQTAVTICMFWASGLKALLPPNLASRHILLNCRCTFLLLSNHSQLLPEVCHFPLELVVGALQLLKAFLCGVLSLLHHSMQAVSHVEAEYLSYMMSAAVLYCAVPSPVRSNMQAGSDAPAVQAMKYVKSTVMPIA